MVTFTVVGLVEDSDEHITVPLGTMAEVLTEIRYMITSGMKFIAVRVVD